jgi:threonine-phosphate decarboxylase
MAKSGQHGGNILQMAQRFSMAPDQIIDFSANINPLGMPTSLKHAICDNLLLAECYPDIDYQDLHQQLAKHHHCHTDQVLAGNGATELIFLWVKQIAPKRALLVEPSFAEYRRALEAIDCDIESVMLTQDHQFCVNHTLLNLLTEKIDCLILCTPNNPTGRLIEPELLCALFHRCQELNIKLLLDESFIDFTPNKHVTVAQLDQFPNLALLRSVTKFFAIPGIRLGFLLSSDTQLLRQIHQQREPWTINVFASLAGGIVFNDHEYIQQTHIWLSEQQDYLYQALSELAPLEVYPTSANYLFFRVKDNPNRVAKQDLQAQLMPLGILIRSCANYPGLSADYYRVAIKSAHDNLKLVTAIKKIFANG